MDRGGKEGNEKKRETIAISLIEKRSEGEVMQKSKEIFIREAWGHCERDGNN